MFKFKKENTIKDFAEYKAPKKGMNLNFSKGTFRELGEQTSDRDKDGFPKAIDCEPNNPKKQGGVSWLIAKAKGKTHDEVERDRLREQVERQREREPIREEIEQLREEKKPHKVVQFLEEKGSEYKEWRKKAPERRAKQIATLDQEIQVMRKKSELAGIRRKMRDEKLKSISGPGMGFGGMPSLQSGPSLMKPFGEVGTPGKKKKKSRKMKMKRKKKRMY